MIKKKTILLLACLMWFARGNAQNLAGRVSGDTENPVPGATLTITGAEIFYAVTDTAGMFSVQLSPGLYDILIEHPDYRPVFASNLTIGTKQRQENFMLSGLSHSLKEIVVKPKEHPVKVDESSLHQYAATFYDPARIITSNASAVNTNDQANHFSARGLPPVFNQWKMEDVEIVNPNHLENAGTLNDRPALNGGGVSMISAQILNKAGFLLPVYPPLHANAIGGILNIQAREPNSEKREHTVQASLLGLDLCTEGPMRRKKSAYLVNARYSTIGLLGAMGVDFGGEKSGFADISALLNVSTRRGSLKAFTVIGNSTTNFDGNGNPLTARSQKDFFRIRYSSATSINGISWTSSISNSLLFRTVAAFSAKRTSYLRDALEPGYHSHAANEQINTAKLSSLMYFVKRFGHHTRLSAGTYLNDHRMHSAAALDSATYAAGSGLQFLQPFSSVSYERNSIHVYASVHGLKRITAAEWIIIPSLAFRYVFTERHSLLVSAGHQAQFQDQIFYRFNNSVILRPAAARTASSRYMYTGRLFRGSAEVFYQELRSLAANRSAGFNAINYFNETLSIPLTAEATATVKGAELTAEYAFRKFYVIASALLLKTQAGGSPFRFDPGKNFALTAGKEWTLKKAQRFFRLDIRGTRREGFRQQDPLSTSDIQLPMYYRADLRLSIRNSSLRSTRLIALDIQNVTGARNVSYYYYDRFTQETEPVYQLGLIPVLSYKAYF